MELFKYKIPYKPLHFFFVTNATNVLLMDRT